MTRGSPRENETSTDSDPNIHNPPPAPPEVQLDSASPNAASFASADPEENDNVTTIEDDIFAASSQKRAKTYVVYEDATSDEDGPAAPPSTPPTPQEASFEGEGPGPPLTPNQFGTGLSHSGAGGYVRKNEK